MPARLTGNTAKSRLAQSLGSVPWTYDNQIPSIANGGAAASLPNTFQTVQQNGVANQAKALNSQSATAAKTFANSTTGSMAGVASALWSTAEPNIAPNIQTKDFSADRNAALDEYGKSVSLAPADQAAYDQARNDYQSSLSGGKTLEQGLNELRQQKGVASIEDRLNQTNDLMRQNQEGLRRATETNPTGSGAMIQSSLESLRSASSRDYIRNLSYLSNIRANTADELNTANSSIDTLLSLRQQDRTNTQNDLKSRIDLLSSKITPDQRDFLKAKLDAKMQWINNAEQIEADRVKAVNQAKIDAEKQKQSYELQRAYTAGDVNSTDPTQRRIAVENAVQGVTSKYKAFPGLIQRSDTQIADEIQKGIQDGTYRDLNDALNRNLVQPIQSKPEFAQVQQKTMGNQYDYKPIQSTDANGNLVTTGYMAVNPNDPNDSHFVNAVPGSQTASGGASSYEWATGTVSNWVTDLSSLYTGNNGPAFANNNPGNIKDTGFGWTPNGKGGFTKYDSVEEWVSALLTKIRNAQTGKSQVYSPDMTLTQFFQKYAPASDNNNPNSYAKFVASYVGAKSGSKIKDVDPEMLAAAIMKHENGAMYSELVKRGIVGPQGITIGSTSSGTQTAPSKGWDKAFDPSLAQVYRDVVNGKYPTGVKPTSENGKKLYEQALAFQDSQTSQPLSNLAQDVMDGKRVFASLPSNQKERVSQELSDKGAINGKTWDERWLNVDAGWREEILNAKRALDLLGEVKSIREKHAGDFGNDMVGSIDSSLYDTAQKLNIGNSGKMKDYSDMQNILQKQINILLKERSGAAISANEYERLMKEVPNLSMGGQQFDEALNNFTESLKSTLNAKARGFGFDDSASMIDRASGKQVQQGTSTGSYDPKYFQ